MVNELILNAVKEASKSHADLPDFEERCIEHAEKLEIMTKNSKKLLDAIKEKAKTGTPDDLEKMYHMCFLAGYQCGMSDEQRKR